MPFSRRFASPPPPRRRPRPQGFAVQTLRACGRFFCFLQSCILLGSRFALFLQGFGWCTMEETAWGDAEHPWVKPGLFTRGPRTYKIPSFNDVPSDMRVKLMDKKNAFAVHSSKVRARTMSGSLASCGGSPLTYPPTPLHTCLLYTSPSPRD